MAVITKTLKTSGGDYSSFTTWESTEQTNLVTATNTHVLECYTGTYTMSGASVSGWTTSATYYITIKAAAGHEHNGVLGAGVVFGPSVASDNVLDLNQNYTRLQDIEVKNDNGSSWSDALYVQTFTTVDRCIVWMSASNAESNALWTGYTGSVTQTYTNCICIANNGTNSNAAAVLMGASNGTYNFYNCTFINKGTSTTSYGLNNENAGLTLNIRNCVAYAASSSSVAFTLNSTGGTRTNNASDDTTAPGTSPVTGITTGAFTNYASNDFSIGFSSALFNVGADLSGTFTTTIDSAVSRTSWDIGAFETPPVITKTLGTGKDYTTLTGWQSGEQTDLTAINKRHELICDAGTYAANTFNISGWTTSSSYYITIKAATGAEHDGVFGGGVQFKTSTASTEAVYFSQAYTRIQDIEIFNDTPGTWGDAAHDLADGQVFERCIFRVDHTTTYSSCLYPGTAADTKTYRNCIFYVDLGTETNSFGIWTNNGSGMTANVQNCTFIIKTNSNIGNCIWDGAGNIDTFNLRNIVGYTSNTGMSCFQISSGTGTRTNNASRDNTAPGTSAVTGITTGAFNNYASNDFSITSGSALYDVGVDLSGTFTDDITGYTRVTWDIGAFEVQGGAPPDASLMPPSRPRFFMQLLQH